jgi:hypothetical protein
MKHQEQKLAAGKSAALTDIPTLRKRARQNIEEGAVTTGYAADRKAVISRNALRSKAIAK